MIVYGIIYDGKFFEEKLNTVVCFNFKFNSFKENERITLRDCEGGVLYRIPSINMCTFITDENKNEYAEYFI